MELKIKILYEDPDILVIDKPSGISVHPSGKLDEMTVSDWVFQNYPETENVGEPMKIMVNGEEKEIKRPGIVHRLDKHTSGVLLLAKNQKAYAFLKEQFQKREVKKIYNALVYGHIKNDTGVIDAPIGRSPSDPRKRIASRGKKGKIREALTEYKVLKRFEIAGQKYSFLEVSPKTGRTHQIRAHLKFLNNPVVCDSLYAFKLPCPDGITRLALHARSIEFKNLAGETMKVESVLPIELEKFTILTNNLIK